MVKNNSEVYDYIIVGAGNVGCVMANRLSESGKYSVCLLESGRDDARIPISEQNLPLKSDAPVPQPEDYDWQQYIRGTFITKAPLLSRGFTDFWFYQKDTPDHNSRSITYDRCSSWGGCTSHNFGVGTRQSPFNWDEWVKLGLTEWSTEKMIHWYKLSQNRSQLNSSDQPYYSESIPVGKMGNFNPKTDGLNGMVPTLWIDPSNIEPNFTHSLKQAVYNLNLNGFDYPNPFDGLVDLGTQDRYLSSRGGLGVDDLTVTDQNGKIIFPNKKKYIPAPKYCQKLYHDDGFFYPNELNSFGLFGLAPYQRVSSATSYLYSIENRPNLKIKSEVLVTKLIFEEHSLDPKVVGVEYMKGWNIYQTGRNPNPLTSGFGGTPGDAKFNAVEAKKNIRRIYARKRVILSAGVFNTPQIMLLSGLGPKKDLEKLGIQCVKNIPGVGKNLVDNTEIFITWQTNPNAKVPNASSLFTLATKSVPEKKFPDFDVVISLNNGPTLVGQVIESMDYTIQNGWMGLRTPGATDNLFVRNSPSSLLLDFSLGKTLNGERGPVGFYPKYFDSTHSCGALIEKEVFNSTIGYVKLQSTDPTVPPKIVRNANNDHNDVQDMFNVFYNTLLPIMLSLHDPNDPKKDFFYGLIDPMPSDILKPGLTQFTSMENIDKDRLMNYIMNRIAGHHAGGTCKMGVSKDSMAVVDQHGHVYGVNNLSIADISIIPGAIRWPGFNLYAIGERLANFILSDDR